MDQISKIPIKLRSTLFIADKQNQEGIELEIITTHR